MVNKNDALFGNISTKAKDSDTGKSISKPNFLGKRMTGLNDQKATEMVPTIRVDPDRCRMWGKHNRNYALLNELSCADLIEGFTAQGKQEFPAIVRRLNEDPEGYDFEVICGARRHWTATYLKNNKWPDFQFLIEVRNLTDEQAFCLADIENRDRLDICAYERALDYQEAVKNYYDNNITQMAKRLECDRTWLSRLLKLAELPETIINACPDITQLNVEHYKKLSKYLDDAPAKKRIVKKASELKGEVDTTQELVKQLVAAGLNQASNQTQSRDSENIITTGNGDHAITWKSKKSSYALDVAKGCSKADINAAFKQFMSDHWGQE